MRNLFLASALALLAATTAHAQSATGWRSGSNGQFGSAVEGASTSGGSVSGGFSSKSEFGGAAITGGGLTQDQRASSESFASGRDGQSFQRSTTSATGDGAFVSGSASFGNGQAQNGGSFNFVNGADASGEAWSNGESWSTARGFVVERAAR